MVTSGDDEELFTSEGPFAKGEVCPRDVLEVAARKGSAI